MSMSFTISIIPEKFDEGTSEEKAAFGLFSMCLNDVSMTTGFDSFINGFRSGPLVSGYHAAEWFLLNWWRQSYEPYSNSLDWHMTHFMPSIGEGYVWPNITISSDGVRVRLTSDATLRPEMKPFWYVGSSQPMSMPLAIWQSALKLYIQQVRELLHDVNLNDSDLHFLWSEFETEQSDPAISKRRRLEALLGQDPDSGEDDAVDRLIADADQFDDDALEEIAANRAYHLKDDHSPLTASDFKEITRKSGYDSVSPDMVTLRKDIDYSHNADIPAWRLGIHAARALRKQEGFGDGPIKNRVLAKMSGVSSDILDDDKIGNAGLSFILCDSNRKRSRIVMRSKWPTSRRFDLARLIGDSLIGHTSALHPATRTYTYRQKMQRAFAAEFLSPFDLIDEMMAGDYDNEETQRDVANQFNVSTKTIETVLMNNGRLNREISEPEFDVAGT